MKFGVIFQSMSPTTEANMAVASSRTLDITKLMRQRNLTSIPKDQKELLEKNDSWAVDLQHIPHGLAAVPSHVVETSKAALIRQKSQNGLHNQSGKIGPPSASTDHSKDENVRPANVDASPTSHSAVSSPERPISSWSASPQHRGKISDESPSVSVPPTAPIATPESRSVPRPEAPLTADHASSSGEDEDLEMDLPQAQERQEAPVNRKAARLFPPSTYSEITATATTTTNTPPCAQPDMAVIPDTVQGNSNLVVKPSEAIHPRPRRMKRISFSDDSPRFAGPSNGPTTSIRMPLTKAFPETEIWNSTSSSSYIAATQQDRTTQNSLPLPVSQSDWVPQSPERPSPIEYPALQDATVLLNRDFAPPAITSNHPVERQNIHRPAPQISTNQRLEPYGAFIVTYPDYVTGHNGNLWHFVQACVCLQFLQAERSLREYLYDDFIRAFSSGFLPYVRNAGLGQEPLPAVEWFNLLKGPILFNRMSVTRDNLDHVLASYPEDVARARAIIKAGDEAQKPSIPESPIVNRRNGSFNGRETAKLRDENQVPTPIRIREKSTPIQQQQQQPPSPHSPLAMQRPASPELGSDAIIPPLFQPPPKSSEGVATPLSTRPRPSGYVERLLSNSQPGLRSRKRSAEEQARLREHFRKRKSNGSSSHVSPRTVAS